MYTYDVYFYSALTPHPDPNLSHTPFSPSHPQFIVLLTDSSHAYAREVVRMYMRHLLTLAPIHMEYPLVVVLRPLHTPSHTPSHTHTSSDIHTHAHTPTVLITSPLPPSSSQWGRGRGKLE
ncbi:hypothetical protein EON63_03545, partial [archaeon]